MKVKVKVFSTLRHFVPESPLHVSGDIWDLPEGFTLKKLLDVLKIPGKEIRIILVNGRKVEDNHRIKEGDTVNIFPMMLGG